MLPRRATCSGNVRRLGARSYRLPCRKKPKAMHPIRVFFVAVVLPAMLAYASLGPPALAGAPPSREIGCFPDNANADPVGTRGHDLDGAVFKDSAMTVSKCLQLCSIQGFKYAGLQNGSWCFCGNRYGQYKAGSASCTTKCAGNQKSICGGKMANSVWQLLQPDAAAPGIARPVPSPGASRPTKTLQRFNRPKLKGVRLDSRPAAKLGFDVVGVANAFCQRMGFAKALKYRVADANQTIAIDDGTIFTNKRGSFTTYRFIICGSKDL